MLMASLIHVGVAAAARHLHVLQVECWWPPRAVHVEVEGDDAPSAAAWCAALKFMHDAAREWPLKKVRSLVTASRNEREEPNTWQLQLSIKTVGSPSTDFIAAATSALQVAATASAAACLPCTT
jgi:hypothetical protein